MTKRYEISVLIPAYNAERFISEAIESVLQQSLQPTEVIIFDDGSTDATAKIIKNFCKQVRYIGPERRGFIAARNFLLERARCDWIAFQDADDIWEQDKLEKQVAYLRSHPECEACMALSAQFLEPGCQLPPTFRKEMLQEPTAMPFIPNLLTSRTVFERVGNFSGDDATGVDSDWFARANDCGVQMGVVQEVLFKRRWHDTNLSHQFEFNSNMLNILRQSIERKRSKTDEDR